MSTSMSFPMSGNEGMPSKEDWRKENDYYEVHIGKFERETISAKNENQLKQKRFQRNRSLDEYSN